MVIFPTLPQAHVFVQFSVFSCLPLRFVDGRSLSWGLVRCKYDHAVS